MLSGVQEVPLVVVWKTRPVFVQVTVSPASIVRFAGLKDTPDMKTLCVSAGTVRGAVDSSATDRTRRSGRVKREPDIVAPLTRGDVRL